MDKFIIGFGLGRNAEFDIVHVPSIREAYAAAVTRTRAKGWAIVDPDELEETFAEPYDEFRARDLGLLIPDQQPWR